MKQVNFKKEWEGIYFEIHQNKPQHYTKNVIRVRELLLYAQCFLAEAELFYTNKDFKKFKFNFELYSISMKHYFKMLSK